MLRDPHVFLPENRKGHLVCIFEANSSMIWGLPKWIQTVLSCLWKERRIGLIFVLLFPFLLWSFRSFFCIFVSFLLKTREILNKVFPLLYLFLPNHGSDILEGSEENSIYIKKFRNVGVATRVWDLPRGWKMYQSLLGEEERAFNPFFFSLAPFFFLSLCKSRTSGCSC